MTKRILPYAVLGLLFVFTAAVLVTHTSSLPANWGNASNPRQIPFGIFNRTLTSVSEDGLRAGLRPGDKLIALNGAELVNDEVWDREFSKLAIDTPASATLERKNDAGEMQRLDVTFTPTERTRDLRFYLSTAVGFTFTYFIPAFCVLLGFWVVLVRPRDPLAWMLLFIMLGFSSISMEGSGSALVRTYTSTFFSTWALSMLLFGIYFPERFFLDERAPWIKWLFIVPLSFQILNSLLATFSNLTGLAATGKIASYLSPISTVAAPMNMAAIALFFTMIGWKSGTLTNPDARRRLRLMMIGTTVAMGPSFIIILIRVFSGKPGSFTDLVPYWFAVLALLLMMLFPLTMAYVIVVQRAMDVSVVVRMGLQYALAKNGVLAIQIVLSAIVILVALSFASDTTSNRPQKIIFIAVGVTLVFVIRLLAGKIRTWVDKRFFRDAYNAEQILADLSDEVRTMVETQPLLERVAGTIQDSLHVPQVALLLKNGGKFVPAYALGFDTEPRVALDGDSRSMRKLAENKHIVLYDDMSEVTAMPTMSLNDREQLTELNSQVLLPVTAKNDLSGIISLSPKRSEEPYTPSDLRLLRSVATQTGLALENSRLTEAIAREAAQKERLNTELEIAREVQERLFPQELPTVQGLDFYGACRPALGVGGDYYDFLELDGGKLGIAIGDISGKGVGASLMMASLQASLRGQVMHFKDDLASLMVQVNALLYEASTSNRYATFFYAQYDPATKLLAYVNAGHNPPFLLRANGEVELLEVGGPVVGMLPAMLVEYEKGEVQLAAGDLLVGFTDGISEAMNPAEEEWGEDSLLAYLHTVRDCPAAEMLPAIVAEADKFANGARQHDDMTMIIAKVV